MSSEEKMKSSSGLRSDVASTHGEILSSPGPVDGVPDGGLRAWLVLLGCSLAFFSSFGIVNSFGVFQDYYASQLLPDSSSSAISIIGAFELFLLYVMGAPVGRFYDAFGITMLFWSGTVTVVLSVMIISFCKEFYQFFLVQGVMFGIGNALIFTPSLAVVSQWFRRRRGLAMGTIAASSSIGGVVYTTMIQRLIPRIGFAWAVRISGFVSLGCLVVACLTVRTRLPLTRKVTLRGIVDFSGFKDVQYTLAAVGSFLYFYAYFIPFFYIQLYGNQNRVDSEISNNLLVIMNALGVLSRVVPGHLADRFGVLEVILPTMFLSAICVLALWLPSTGSGLVVAFSALYGLFSGAFLPLLPAYIAHRSPVDRVGARMGSLYIFVGISSLVGTPTAGAFLPEYTQRNFRHLIVFAGVVLLAGSVAFCGCYLLSRRERRFAEKYDGTSEKEEGRQSDSAVSTPL